MKTFVFFSGDDPSHLIPLFINDICSEPKFINYDEFDAVSFQAELDTDHHMYFILGVNTPEQFQKMETLIRENNSYNIIHVVTLGKISVRS